MYDELTRADLQKMQEEIGTKEYDFFISHAERNYNFHSNLKHPLQMRGDAVLKDFI